MFIMVGYEELTLSTHIISNGVLAGSRQRPFVVRP